MTDVGTDNTPAIGRLVNDEDVSIADERERAAPVETEGCEGGSEKSAIELCGCAVAFVEKHEHDVWLNKKLAVLEPDDSSALGEW
jgi:hypothetical protein